MKIWDSTQGTENLPKSLSAGIYRFTFSAPEFILDITVDVANSLRDFLGYEMSPDGVSCFVMDIIHPEDTGTMIIQINLSGAVNFPILREAILGTMTLAGATVFTISKIDKVVDSGITAGEGLLDTITETGTGLVSGLSEPFKNFTNGLEGTIKWVIIGFVGALGLFLFVSLLWALGLLKAAPKILKSVPWDTIGQSKQMGVAV